jgi:hypothetical protein
VERPQQAQHAQQQHEEEEDRFAAAFSRLSMRGIRARKRSAEPASRRGSQAALAALAGLWGGEEEEAVTTPPPPARQWHFFTVSPDAPTNPVLYWMGHVDDIDMPRFELEGAKGPYRLDLGDVLYAPNVCQDGQGRWLMWGWLQERRKVGSYSYAGCLTLPRVLHCTEDGRLVQAPIPELSQLRQGPGWHQHLVHVPAESTVPLAAAPGLAALDIELTLDRGTAFAAGLLFRSHEAEAEGGTALIYDWERNALEAIFNVPPNWQPPAAPHTAKFSGSGADGSEVFDPALLLTPRPSELMLGQEFSRTPSALFSPDLGFGFESQTASAAATPRTATESLGGEASSALLSPQRSGITIAGATPRPTPLDLGIPGLPLPPHLADEVAGQGASFLPGAGQGAVAFSTSLPRSLGGLGGAGGAGSLPTGGLYRSVSDVRMGAGGMTRVGSHPALQSYGSSLPRLGGGGVPLSPGARSPRLPQPPGIDTDADLDFLLDELAAPMREAPPPIVEPRRVGGPLPTMRANAPLHLRILVDHSCVEVYTGTGETLSTRIYRGQAPEGATDAGISLLAFGGTALVRRCSCYEMGSAWEHPAVAAAISPKVAAKAAPSPKQAAVLAAAAAASAAGSRGGSAAASPAAKAGKEAVRLEPAGADEQQAALRGASPAAAAAAAAAADALLDEMVMLSPQCSAAVVGAFA